VLCALAYSAMTPHLQVDHIVGGSGGAVVECPTRDRKVPGSIPGGTKK